MIRYLEFESLIWNYFDKRAILLYKSYNPNKYWPACTKPLEILDKSETNVFFSHNSFITIQCHVGKILIKARFLQVFFMIFWTFIKLR